MGYILFNVGKEIFFKLVDLNAASVECNRYVSDFGERKMVR